MMMSPAPTRLKATTNSQNSRRIFTVRSAIMASSPVARSAYAANAAKRARPPAPGAIIRHRRIRGDVSQLCKIGGRGEPAGVKLVEGTQLLGREALILRAERDERRLEPFVRPVAR